MTSQDFSEAVTRDTILKLFTDAENAKISNLEDGKALGEGDEYIDLDDLRRGVQRSSGDVAKASAVPRAVLSAETWTKIVAMLAH